MYGLYFLDFDCSINFWVIMEIIDVIKIGFWMKFILYDDLKLYGVKINWMVCGK